MKKPKPYQADCVKALTNAYRSGRNRALVVMVHTAVASGRWCGGQWPQCGLSCHHESAH